MTKNIMKAMALIGYAIWIILAIDVIGFVLWAFSGQVPPDSFFVGSITRSILQAIFY